ncbi:hypothetical protein CYLTODRAFT_428523 [Cylindrobasidium torrendii FP15055 ss-10]|uniref:Aminoglycoside phosphotransferase domain-containing protein n=1 Tax=Cylindrobasidium torrendii FP15055 ss-10 TaxID=1314674 RepID=A0A0D7BTD6_9AGAR|nr:hypothetical protein CYLTODRAFT_428523 [Cylindrobasidium torrendii FP15055 ss-10]
MMDPESSELFNYTTGRFLTNDARRLQERRRVFNIPGLFNIIAQAVHCEPGQIVDFRKLGEGGLNRVFLVTLDTGLRLVARIPYPLLTPKAHAVASEVATMDFLRLKGLPVPKVYSYSFTSDNEAGTEYVLMEYVKGIDLSGIWADLKEHEIISLMDQLTTVESALMSIAFPAGGSIYYTNDLQELGSEGVLLDGQLDGNASEEKRFCIGPDLSVPLWYGRREQLEVFRGPYEDAKSVLLAGAMKELAYLDQFGAPRAPYERLRREHYNYEQQPPSDHAQNLGRYVRLAPSLVPDDSTLSAFCIRHPDLTDSNIRVSTENGGLQILSVLDWQHATVLPLFLHAGIPGFIQNEEDDVSRKMIAPKLPDDFDKLPGEEQEQERELLRRRLVHYHYVLSTATYNRVHHKGFVYPLNSFRRRIFIHASAIWEGETIKLLCALIDLVLGWEDIVTDGTPCPLVFTEEEIRAADKLHRALTTTEGQEMFLRYHVGYGDDTWVPTAHYETAKALGEELKRRTLEACAGVEDSDKVYGAVQANWPLDDMDEAEFEEFK